MLPAGGQRAAAGRLAVSVRPDLRIMPYGRAGVKRNYVIDSSGQWVCRAAAFRPFANESGPAYLALPRIALVDDCRLNGGVRCTVILASLSCVSGSAGSLFSPALLLDCVLALAAQSLARCFWYGNPT